MMKVAPSPSTSGIIAAWLMRTKLPKVRKFGLMTAMIAQSRMSTMTGAQDASRAAATRSEAPAPARSGRSGSSRSRCGLPESLPSVPSAIYRSPPNIASGVRRFRERKPGRPAFLKAGAAVAIAAAAGASHITDGTLGRPLRPRPLPIALAVLDLPAGAAPDVVPVELRLRLDVAVVERLGVLGGDGDARAVELAVLLRLLRRDRTRRSWRGSRSTGPCRPARTDPRRRCRPSRP